MSDIYPVILGIDPGTRITGYGVIQIQQRQFITLDYGCIKPPPTLPLPERFLILFEALEELLDRFCPTAISIETQFVYKNAQSALKLGMAKGIALLAGAKRGIPIYEYAPTKAKASVVGRGHASKEQVQQMMQLLLKLPKPPTPEDAADALALAICHAHQMHLETTLKKVLT